MYALSRRFLLTVPVLVKLTTPFPSHQIRYQGILHSIDPVEATVSLEKGESYSGTYLAGWLDAVADLATIRLTVMQCILRWRLASHVYVFTDSVFHRSFFHTIVRSLGTEGRKANPSEEIPGNDNVYECVPRTTSLLNLTADCPLSSASSCSAPPTSRTCRLKPPPRSLSSSLRRRTILPS